MNVQNATNTPATPVFTGIEVEADGLSLKGEHGWVYRDVSFTAPAGTLTVIEGEAGTGRTSLLLTLAGRMKPSAGTLTVGGRTKLRKIQRIAALGLVSEVNPFDDALSVREHLHERLRPRGLPWRRRHADIVHAALHHAGLDLAALPESDRTLTRQLTRDQEVRLGIALALLDEPGLIVVDDADTGLGDGRLHELWQTLRDLADDGLTVIATCTDAREASGLATTAISLTATTTATTTAMTTAMTTATTTGATSAIGTSSIACPANTADTADTTTTARTAGAASRTTTAGTANPTTPAGAASRTGMASVTGAASAADMRNMNEEER
ncbi:ATP-binding cassette domain-containing protein [Planotetraspora sp. A-T 1434]|uniref:ABC transporter ATP-binding protein n=1 Tax=Planotetraspora sp. A-T 1434 TaxID=2979219 RepID=UPI0021C13BFA|nr:ATP-binding cassette domain-containing protein [Planotetraspora sp. A-T 1434]MCT9928928.1 ATP-binding cassette domain-containing protein [Planotetraspora sp. A-T 1434]